jgi:hypothetical protein
MGICSWFRKAQCPHPSYWCGNGTVAYGFFDDGSSLHLASKICTQCFYEFYDDVGYRPRFRKDLADRAKRILRQSQAKVSR